MKVTEGSLTGNGQRHALVVAQFNDFITSRLAEGAVSAFRKHGVEDSFIEVFHVPGAFELGVVAKKLAQTGKYNAVTCIGAVIKGATDHYDHVAGQATKLVAQAGYDTGVPVIFGVLTTETIEQAIERAGTKAGNKGYEAGVSAVEMASLMEKIG